MIIATYQLPIISRREMRIVMEGRELEVLEEKLIKIYQ